MPVSEQEFGVALGRLGSVEKSMDRMESKLDGNTAKTDAILSKINGLEGSWRALLGVAVAAATIAGLVVKFIPWGTHPL